MKKELEKTYDPQQIEGRLYEKWLNRKYFAAKVDKKKKPFTIVMPPPNITGQLHMGHALDNTMQDILIRYKRMQGYEALWQPGTDHASIATEVKITEKLKEEGIDKAELGREKFLERAWEWRKKEGGADVPPPPQKGPGRGFLGCGWGGGCLRQFLCSPGCPGAQSIIQAGHELTEFSLPLPLECTTTLRYTEQILKCMIHSILRQGLLYRRLASSSCSFLSFPSTGTSGYAPAPDFALL